MGSPLFLCPSFQYMHFLQRKHCGFVHLVDLFFLV
nr:MAG TPA: hypothetical protein [Caudoviricetes sp.]